MNNIVPFTLHCFTMDLSQNGFVTLFVEFRGFFVPPCPPLRPCCQLVGHSLPWHARVSMNIASEHVNKKHQKTKHLRLFLSKKASLHDPIQSDAGHYQIWELVSCDLRVSFTFTSFLLAVLKFDPLRPLCQNGPIWPHHEEHKETPVFFAQARLTSNTCFGRNFMRIYHYISVNFHVAKTLWVWYTVPKFTSNSWCMSHVISWYNEKGLSGNRDTLFTAIFMEYDDKTLDFSGYKYYKPRMI